MIEFIPVSFKGSSKNHHTNEYLPITRVWRVGIGREEKREERSWTLDKERLLSGMLMEFQ